MGKKARCAPRVERLGVLIVEVDTRWGSAEGGTR